MRIRATRSFAGVISMRKGQEMDCDNKKVVQDLLNCGYVEKVKVSKAAKTEDTEQPESAENGGDTDESEQDSAQ